MGEGAGEWKEGRKPGQVSCWAGTTTIHLLEKGFVSKRYEDVAFKLKVTGANTRWGRD